MASISYAEEFFLNSRGLKLFTCRWLPVGIEARALVFLCHGYGMECSEFMKGVGVRLAKAGYGVFGVDIEGHGKSEGMRCYIRSFSLVVDDCVAFFKSIREREEYEGKPRFLYGESMGGAVALLIHRKEPEIWNGAVLVAPMCKISEKLKPPQLVVSVLTRLAHVIPTWKIVPTRDIVETGFKDPLRREEIRSNPYTYLGKPRLRTGLELLNASMYLEERLDEVTLPFLLLHGEEDAVTEAAVSRHLHQVSRSPDKTLNMYAGMWHGLTFGEPPHNMELVFRDIIAWLHHRAPNPRPPSSSPDILKQADLSNVLDQHRDTQHRHKANPHTPPPLSSSQSQTAANV